MQSVCVIIPFRSSAHDGVRSDYIGKLGRISWAELRIPGSVGCRKQLVSATRPKRLIIISRQPLRCIEFSLETQRNVVRLATNPSHKLRISTPVNLSVKLVTPIRQCYRINHQQILLADMHERIIQIIGKRLMRDSANTHDIFQCV